MLTEHALILSLVVIVAIASLILLGDSTFGLWVSDVNALMAAL